MQIIFIITLSKKSKYVIKQSNQTKLKNSLISLCGLNHIKLPFDLEISTAFFFLSPLLDTIWDFYGALNGTWTAIKMVMKSTILPSSVFVGLQGNLLPEVKQSPFLIWKEKLLTHTISLTFVSSVNYFYHIFSIFQKNLA